MTGNSAIGHQAIAASAGSGKTFQLAHRYLRLLADGVSPEEIVALTFSRKAAGEIFDSIVAYLCEAAATESGARSLARRIGNATLSQVTCRALLRGLLNSLHRLHVGTLDSFSISILRSFPLELGIPPGFDLMDSDSAPADDMRRRILASILHEGGAGLRAPREFLEFFAQANQGRLDKQVQQSLVQFIVAYQSHLRALPQAERWGNAKVIWPGGTPWLDTPNDVESAASGLERLLDTAELPEDAALRWGVFIAAARSYTVHSHWTRDVQYLFEKLAECVGDLRRGAATVKLNRTVCDLTAEIARHVLALMTHIVRTDMNASLTRTRGIHGLLSTYEQHYDTAMRREGVLSFTDAQHLLTAANGEGGGTILSSEVGNSRLYIDYRLDARLNHWLLDEFQDTSDLQWQVLENLIDEAIQDDSGRRSLFYVGDVKQAIYGWRGGNPRLFDVPLTRYLEKIRVVPLHESFRSCPSIIGTVNRVFGDLATSDLPPRTVARWQRYWEPHQSAQSLKHVEGFATVLEPLCADGAVTPTPADRYRLVARLLNEIQPLARGLTTAVLVRSNDQGRAIVDFLRSECPDMTIIHEGRAAIKDNPVVAVLLSLVAYAAHPGDLLAWRHLQMSPILEGLDHLHVDQDSLAPRVLRDIQARGFQRALREWANRLDGVQTLDNFGRIRLDQFLAAAGEFDAAGSTDCDKFLAHVEHHELHDVAADDALRVMTVHQAKGLGFDVVILPELDKNSMVKARDLSFVLSREPTTQRPQWALELPRRMVAQCDDTLREEVEKSDADAAFESLCLLYVSMTRARRGLYVITSYPGRNSRVYNQSALVKERLHGDGKPTEKDGLPVMLSDETFTSLYSHGAERWYEALPPTRTKVPAKAAPPDLTRVVRSPSLRTRLVAIRPSDADALDTSAAQLFHPDRRQRLDTGIAVHSLLQRVTWAEETDIAATVGAWSAETDIDHATKTRAVEHFRRAMASRPIAAEFARPRGSAVLWRERHFDVVLGDRWVTGTFDRVVIEQDMDGIAIAASLYDFKTDEIRAGAVAAQASLYRQQLELYRDSLAHILRLSPSRIRMVLLFTTPGVVFDFPPARETVRRDRHRS